MWSPLLMQAPSTLMNGVTRLFMNISQIIQIQTQISKKEVPSSNALNTPFISSSEQKDEVRCLITFYCVGTPCLSALLFIALHRCCVFYKLKARPSTSRKINTGFKIETDSQIESRLTAMEGVGKGVEGSSKKEKGLMDMDNSVVMRAGWGRRV